MARSAAAVDLVTATAAFVGVRVAAPWLVDAWPLRSLLARLTTSREVGDAELPRGAIAASRLAERVVARVPGVKTTCLYRALARYTMLRRLGVPVRFVMGIHRSSASRGAPDLAGHAWLELDGAPLDEELADDLVETFSHPPAREADTTSREVHA